MTLVAGVDSSTQSCKVVVRDLETGRVVRSGRAPHPPGTEVDPERWWEALCLALADAGGLADVAAISVAAQQHGMVALDADGRVVRPALLWNDTRSAQSAQSLIAELGAEELAARAGSVPVASFTSTKLRWLRDAEPHSAARVAAVALPHDWLTWRLLGHGPRGEGPLGPDLHALTTDRSDASGTGYWSPGAEDWDRELLSIALGHGAALPRVVAPSGSPGRVVTQPSVAGGALLGAGAGDNAGAALGLATQPGDIVMSLGTSGTAFAVAEALEPDPTGTVAGFADATGRFLPLVATLNAARVLDAVAALLGVDHAQLGALAMTAAPGAGGLVLQPYFEGERTPNLPDATATLFGMTLASTTRANLARAAVEGMLCGLAEGVDAIVARGSGRDRLLLIGGAAQGSPVARIASQVLGLPVDVPATAEYVALGAAVQAAWALTGERPAWPVALSTQVDEVPRPSIRAQYRARR